jgi:hypothetical protein
VSASNDGSPTSDAGTDNSNARRSTRASGPTSPADAARERETAETNDDGNENENENQNQNENESEADSEENDDGACERCASAFYAELEREMAAASKAYFGWTLKILTRAPLGGKSHKSGVYKKSISGSILNRARFRGFPCAPPLSRRELTTSVRLGTRFVEASQDAPDLRGLHIDATTEARECLRWAELNATALRKILKKWDKTNVSSRGRKALAAYWKKSEYQMLHSPVTMELRAVAGMLTEGEDGPVWDTSLRNADKGNKENDAPRSFGTYPSSSFGSGSEMDGLDVSAFDAEQRNAVDARLASQDQPTCGVCLDTLYKPVGLECGHVFCRDCLLRAAGVLDHRGTSIAVSLRGRQTVSRVAAGEAALEPVSWRERDKCPECRHEGVFLTSTRLRHVEACIKRLDPEGHAARRAESKRAWRDATKFAWGHVPKAVADALKNPSGSSAVLSVASFVVGVVVAVVAL